MQRDEKLLDENLLCRIQTAKQRALLAIRQIDRLSRSDFPHPDGRDALGEIRKRFAQQLDQLEGATGLSARVLRGLAQNIHFEVELYLPVMGFILRSTNVRNAFELYDPLKVLVKKVLGPSTKLILSSEWDFVPFTYPMTLEALPEFVLVGGPAHESHNPFIVPLSGHEIGHSVWQLSDVGDELETRFAYSLQALIDADADLQADLIDEYGEDYLGQVLEFAIKRIEEFFCDAFGYRLFGDAYAFAFERVLYPGLDVRDERYPSMQQRLRLLRFMSDRSGGNLPEGFEDGWVLEGAGIYGDLDDLIDKASEEVFEIIAEIAESVCAASGIAENDASLDEDVFKVLRTGVPYSKQVTVSNILNGAWLAQREKYAGGVGDFEDLLGEITLKSIEVSHYLDLTGASGA